MEEMVVQQRERVCCSEGRYPAVRQPGMPLADFVGDIAFLVLPTIFVPLMKSLFRGPGCEDLTD